MKKIRNLVALLIIAASLTSCISNKEMTYIQGADSIYVNGKAIQKDFSLQVQSDDQLAISVSSKNAELIRPFNNQTLIGGGQTNNGSSTANTTSGISYFYVDKEGLIDFPIFGKMKVAGKSVNEISAEIEKLLKEGGHIQDAVVTTRITSFKVTILGDVRTPGVQSYTGQRLTLLEALGRAGDLNSSAIRTRVLVIREENGKRVSYKIDLTKPESVFASPAYYMQQNDLVYVESNKSVKVKGSTSYTYLTVSGTLVGMAASIVSLIIALTN